MDMPTCATLTAAQVPRKISTFQEGPTNGLIPNFYFPADNQGQMDQNAHIN